MSSCTESGAQLHLLAFAATDWLAYTSPRRHNLNNPREECASASSGGRGHRWRPRHSAPYKGSPRRCSAIAQLSIFPMKRIAT